MSEFLGGSHRAVQIGLIVVAGLLGLLIGILLTQNNSTPAVAESQEAFAERVREALVSNPFILSEAFNALETQSRNAEVNELQDAVTRNLSLIETAPASIAAGNPNGDITIVEFFDYECPYCRRALPRMNALRAADDGIRFIYFEMPILGESSLLAALAALAAHEQGGYEQLHNLMMSSEGRLNEGIIMEFAVEAGLDPVRLREDMANPLLEDRLRSNMQLAQAVGVGSTPTFLVNGQVVIGWREEEVTRLLDEARGD